MAAFKTFLLLVILSLFLRSFAQAEIATAHVPKLWLNNNASLASVESFSPRIILYAGEYPYTGGFCFAFYPDNNNNSSFFLVVARLYDYGSDSPDTRVDIIWTGNQNKPVHENATLQLLDDGNLVLKDVDGTQIWTTNSSDKSVVGMRLMETGNLVLFVNENNTVWQSFDHPTHMLMVGQNLKPGQKLVANFPEIDTSEVNYLVIAYRHGDFFLRFASSLSSNIIWSANPNKPVRENASLELLNDGNLVLKDVDGTQIWTTNSSDKSVVGMRLMETGNLVLFVNENNTVWQSFDHPTHMLMVGQNLKPGQKLVANFPEIDKSEVNYLVIAYQHGDFFLRFTSSLSSNIIWSANPNRPVRENASLELLNDGNLVLKDADGTLIWTTDSSDKSVVGMRLTETGNLTLFDSKNNTVWQSFYHLLMVGQKLMPGQKLVARFSETAASEGQYLAIDNPYYHSDYVLRFCSFLSSDIIWSANPNKPVRGNATLELLNDGNLVLKDADGTLIWNTNSSGESVVGMKLTETGNLVLFDNENNTVWQSFDHPTDRLRVGQKLMPGQKLVTSMSEENYVVIVYEYKYNSEYTLRFDNSLSSNIIWSANRNKPVGGNATLELLNDGNLILKDADGTLIWTTNSSDKSVDGMKLTETGNLVLFDNENNTVWQSFDHPTDTLVVGQKLMPGQKLVARVSETDMSEGNYQLVVTFQGFFACYQAIMPLKYLNFRYSASDSLDIMKSIEVNYHESKIALFVLSVQGDILQMIFESPTNFSSAKVRLDTDGHLRLYNQSNDVVYDILENYLATCQYPTSCGSFALCNGGGCSCPAEFVKDPVSNAQGKHGCSPINPSSVACENSAPQSFLSIADVYYFNYIDHEAAFVKGVDVERCKDACMAKCSCEVVLFRYFQNTSFGDCYFPSPVLSLINDDVNTFSYKSSAFIKISSTKNGKMGAGRRRLIIALTTGISSLLIFIFVLRIVFLRKKKDWEEETEESFEQLPGMPIRFTFEELKIATGGFQKKLGQGGFGSVFEGSLQSGEKIAVKRLDSVSQGKKEFLAEVKTIGSIHHVNLVRLIGFCTEKSHRLLVYEFMWNGSLDKWIFKRQPYHPSLDCEIRKKVILDIAKGLAYLHDECVQRIVHLDIKPQNILLDANLHAKIADFGLSS